MRPLIQNCDVEMFGSLDVDGETHEHCRLTMIGNPAQVVLYSKEIGGARWQPIDRLTQAIINERPDGGLTITGMSDELVQLVGLSPAEAIVRWEVTVRGCRNC